MNLEEAFMNMMAADLREPVQMAEADVRVGRAGKPVEDRSVADVAASALEIPAAGVKGAAQGFAGLFGDLEGVGRLLINLAGGNVSEETVLKTTEQIKQLLDDYVGKVGTGENPFETVGEFLAPGGYIKGAKKAIKAGKTGAEKVTKKAKEVMSKSQDKRVRYDESGRRVE